MYVNIHWDPFQISCVVHVGEGGVVDTFVFVRGSDGKIGRSHGGRAKQIVIKVWSRLQVFNTQYSVPFHYTPQRESAINHNRMLGLYDFL